MIFWKLSLNIWQKSMVLKNFIHEHLIIGTPDKDLRVMAVVGDSEDNSIEHVNLNKVDDELDCNGDHAFAKFIDPATFIKKNFDGGI